MAGAVLTGVPDEIASAPAVVGGNTNILGACAPGFAALLDEPEAKAELAI
jgi:hypothetical protein